MISHSIALDEIELKYSECPNVCAEGFKPSTCEGCPVKTANEFFTENLTDNLETRCKGKGDWREFGIPLLKKTVVDICELENTDSRNWTIKTDYLVKELKAARNRQEKIQRDAAPKNS